MRGTRTGWVLAAAAVLLTATTAPAAAAELTVTSGPARAVVTDSPWSIALTQARGRELREARGVSFRDAGGTHHAVRARSMRRDGEVVLAEVEVEDGQVVTVRVAPAESGVIAVDIRAPAGAAGTGTAFLVDASDRFYGAGERSDAVDRRRLDTENYVSDGPFRPEDRQYVRGIVPPWADRDRDDATYYPVPWMLLSRGWGVLVDEDVTSRLRPLVERADRFAVEADGSRLRLRLFAGPTPAQVLARFTAATGRQPEPEAPWTFGPWFQTGQPNVIPPAEEEQIIQVQRDAGVPVSVGETQMHHLPCGAHEDRRPEELARNEMFHRAGLSRLVYFNPLLCASYTKVFGAASAAGVLQRTPLGAPFLYPAFVGGSGPAGFTQEPLAQFDFTNPATEAFYASLVKEAVDLGADGWMEDFGESTPTSGMTQHDGTSGDAAHNRYPTDYHCAMRRIAERIDRPLVRFLRSGWTGTARCAEVVWGGDPTTVWGFDGLSSAVKQVLSIGMSGVARWGTDIGGYNSFGAGQGAKPGATEDETLTPELLMRWIEFGALIPVMRTKRTGIAIPSYTRPQVFDPARLQFWRRMTELHHQLNPYLRGADDEHRRTGLPIVRHLVLHHPESPRARDAHDEYLLGPDLLAAPVTAPGLTARSVWLPPGKWVDWWRSTSFEEPTGTHRLGAATVLRGTRDHTIPAPLGRPPLLLRAGAVVPMLEGDIDTLSPYGREAGLVRLADRADRLRLISAPRARTTSRLDARTTARSEERRRRWFLSITGPTRRRYSLEISTRAMLRPFHPRTVLVNGRPLPRSRWSYSTTTGVLRLAVTGARVRVDARATP